MNRKSIQLFICVFALLFFACHGQECQYISKGYEYKSLIQLKVTNANNPQNYYNGVNSASPQPYTLYANVCGNADIGCEPTSAACQETQGGDYYGCGLLNNQTFSTYINPATTKEEPNKGVYITYYGGEKCTLANKVIERQTTIILTCDSSVKTFSTPVVSEPTPCHYQIAFSSQHACPDGKLGGIDGGWIFVIIVLVGLALYFIIGIIIKIVVYKASGKDILPNADFWTELPSLIKDGFVFLFDKITCRGNSYKQV
eukprot:TRINITY_DN13934_c0_g1_i1.p1 TRINITY_DN13934_c0_g1~~TRINITY_DN13934_c0_g1_i1.p1  ORF type:complete len:267 (-),score=58.26 TRINITY_DN13934_c0_g1_i1:63-833(-)